MEQHRHGVVVEEVESPGAFEDKQLTHTRWRRDVCVSVLLLLLLLPVLSSSSSAAAAYLFLLFQVDALAELDR